MTANNGFWKRLAAGAVVVASVWTAAAQVDIELISPVDGAALTNGMTVTVFADVTTNANTFVESVWLAYSWEGSPFTTNQMTNVVGGVRYEAVIPRLAAGALTNRVFCLWTNGVDGVTNETVSADFNYVVSATILSPLRFSNFNTSGSWVSLWTPNNSSMFSYTNMVGGSEVSDWWFAEMGRWPITTATVPPGGGGPVFGIRPFAGAYIQAPRLADGVGTIYYSSIISHFGYGAEMAIQYTTNNVPQNWQTATNVVYDAKSGYLGTNSAPVILNRRDIRYVRFLRTDNGIEYSGKYVDPYGTVGFIYIDNIYISQPPTSVTITEEQYNPGYPAQDQDVRVRCRVTDGDDGYPSVNRQVRVFYSWEDNSSPHEDWPSTNMTLIADDVYEGVIPQHGAGMMYYYFRCTFDGYFYKRDPDGPSPGTQPERNEKDALVHPAYLKKKGSANYRNYEIRRYQSDVKVMRVLADPPSATVDMELVADHVWQGLTLVSGITNMNWTFRGIDGYAEDAAGYDNVPWMWGDNNQDFPYPPIAGYAERDATNSIAAQLEYDGFLLIRLNRQENTNSYIVKRAVYQNFNVWPASQTDFAVSLGLYAIKTFEAFEDDPQSNWVDDFYEQGQYKLETLDSSTPDNDFVRGDPALTYVNNFWAYDQARIVKERDVYNQALSVFQDRNALELDGGVARGRVWNTYASKTEGVGNFDFRARLSLNDNYFSYFKGVTGGLNPFIEDPTNWPLSYRAEATFRAATLSPGMGSISLLTRIRPGVGLFDPPSYYETRLSQGDPTIQNQELLNLEVFRWKNGVATKIGSTVPSQGVSPYSLTGVKTVRVGLTNVASYVRITVSVDRQGRTDNNFDWGTFTFDDASDDRLTEVGTVGFISFDAQIEVQQVRVMAPGTARTANLLPGDNWATQLTPTNWYMGGTAAGVARWRISDNYLLRNIPTQKLGIYLAPMPDGSSMQPNFAELQKKTEVELSGLGYTTYSVPLKLWNESFVMIKNEATGEINAVVDNLALSPWRAVTRADKTSIESGTEEEIGGVKYYNWTSTTQQDTWVQADGNTGWLVLEGWVTTRGSNEDKVQFDRTRANTNLVQALISPYLTNNIGEVIFNWRASGISNVVYIVERSAPGSSSTWDIEKTVTNSTLSGKEQVAFGTDFPGRIRIRVGAATKADAWFEIDNLVVRDYPPRDNTTWQAYNALISSEQTSKAFEPTDPTAKTAYLNNSTTNDVKGELKDSQPYIQTPEVGTGIGEIAFWYRVWDTQGGPAKISLQAAPDAESGSWKELTNIVVEAGQTDYVYFWDDDIFEPDNKVLRIYCITNETYKNRVCIDNVLMTEPVRPGYEFRAVTLSPEQPLVGQQPGLEVEIGRFIMNPEQIKIYVSYLVGTNTWGYTNWWTSAYPQKIELEEVAPRIYRTPEGLKLPSGAIDEVVQFIVWGVHSKIQVEQGDKPIYQGTNAFINPAWHFPVDLNGMPSLDNPAGKGAYGWSPYYFVYSCPPKSVWVNEVCYRTRSSENDLEYIEIIGPTGANVGGWKLQMRDVFNELWRQSTINAGFQFADVSKGWGFFVWGDAAVPNVSQVIPGSGPGTAPDILVNGGLRLVRSNGAWEDRVSWGTYGEDMQNDYGYLYAGEKGGTSPLSLQSTNEFVLGQTAADFDWRSATYSPGAINPDQEMVELEPVTAFFMVYSVIGLNGAHSVGVNPLEMIAVPQGGSTNITYTADDWYRIDAFLSDGEVVGSALGERSYEWTVIDVQGDVSNHVMFVEAYPGVSTNWLGTWGADTGQTLHDSVPSLDYAYMLDIDPWAAHEIAYMITGMTVSNGSATITVKLTDYGVGHGPINGQVAVYARESLTTGTWGAPIAYAMIGEIDDNGEAVVTIDTLPADALFFKSEIVAGD